MPHAPPGMAALSAAGRSLGLAFGHYLVWLGRSAAERGASRIHFLSREGHWLARHYALLRASRSDGLRWPAAVSLAVSRQSTFLPSLPALTEAAIQPLLAQYRAASVATVLRSLGLADPQAIGARLPLDQPWNAPGVAASVLADAGVQAVLDRRRVTQRAALRHYLEQQGLVGSGAAVVADIGWRGSIQDNLGRLLPGTSFTGFYFGLQRPFVPAERPMEKHGFILGPEDPPRLARRLRFVAPLEFAMSGSALSAIGYTLEADAAQPLFDAQQVAPDGEPGFAVLQAALAEGIAQAAQLRDGQPDLARRLVLSVIEDPPAALVDLYFQAWRDDRFGAGILRRGARRLRAAMLPRAAVSRAARRDLGQALADSGWPWAMLNRDIPWAAPLLRRVILGLDARL